MKRSITTLLIAGTTNLLMAQAPTIVQDDLTKVGDVIFGHYDTLDVAKPILGGANRSWDYSKLKSHILDTSTYISPNSTPYFSKYPTSNLAWYDAEADNYDYFTVNSTGEYEDNYLYDYYYFTQDDEQIYRFNAPLKPSLPFIKIPATFNSNWNSTVAANVTVKGDGVLFDSVRAILTIQTSVVADGWGTLTTPAGTFPKTLRLVQYYSFTSQTDILANGASWENGVPQTTLDTSYSWWTNGVGWPVLEIANSQAIATGGVQNNSPYHATWYTSNRITSGLEDVYLKNGASIYPNPTLDEFTVLGVSKLLGVFDGFGNNIEFEATPSDSSIKVKLANPAPGLYIVKASKSNGEIFNYKLSVTR